MLCTLLITRCRHTLRERRCLLRSVSPIVPDGALWSDMASCAVAKCSACVGQGGPFCKYRRRVLEPTCVLYCSVSHFLFNLFFLSSNERYCSNSITLSTCWPLSLYYSFLRRARFVEVIHTLTHGITRHLIAENSNGGVG